MVSAFHSRSVNKIAVGAPLCEARVLILVADSEGRVGSGEHCPPEATSDAHAAALKLVERGSEFSFSTSNGLPYPPR